MLIQSINHSRKTVTLNTNKTSKKLTEMSATFSKEFINDFIDYVMSFYGAGELYPIKGINRTIVRKATNDLIRIIRTKGQAFCGDSIDREEVCNLLLFKYNLSFVK